MSTICAESTGGERVDPPWAAEDDIRKRRRLQQKVVIGGSSSSPSPPEIKKKKRGSHASSTASVRVLRSSARHAHFESIQPLPRVPYPPGTRGQGLNALMRAARTGRVQDFDQLAGRRPWLFGATDKLGRSLLHHAVVGGCHAIIQAVIKGRKQPVDTRASGITPMHVALHQGDVEVCAMLLAAGADPSMVEEDIKQLPLLPAIPKALPDKAEEGAGEEEEEGDEQQEEEEVDDYVAALAALCPVRRPIAEVLRTLYKAMAMAVPIKDDEVNRPWTDLETQRQLAMKWQQSLLPGSQVDACDCDGKWYEAEVVDCWEGVGGIREVRVHYRCWGRKFDEDLSLASLRVLPAYSVVPRWRGALAVGSPLESLSSTWLGNPPDGKEERKWWDSTVQAVDRSKNQVLISVDGRAVLSRWVDIDGEDISMAGTHVKPSPFLGLAQANNHHGNNLNHHHHGQQHHGNGSSGSISSSSKDAIVPSTRQLAARESARTGDVTRLLSLISLEPPGSLALQYYRAKAGLAGAVSSPAMMMLAAAATTPNHSAGSLGNSNRRRQLLAPLLLSPDRPPLTLIPNPVPKSCSAFEEQRMEVLKWVVMDMKEDLVQDLMQEYMPLMY